MLRRFVLILSVAAAIAATSSAAEIKGKVSGVIGKDVRLTVDGDLLPQPGDDVTIRFEIPGGPMVVVGSWRVTSIDGDSVLAAMVEATGAPAIGQLASIVSPNPAPRRPPPPPPSTSAPPPGVIRVSFDARMYDTTYEHQIVEGKGLDIYFFKAVDAGVDASGNQRFNRFVRDPAEGSAGEHVWWVCRWVWENGEWMYVQTKVGDVVAVLRDPVDVASLDGSVWRTRSSELTGDRKGQSFDFDVKVTVANGVVRMSSETAYAEGRILGARFTYSTYLPDGSGPVGQGSNIFSGDSFTGGWTATNGREGRWEGRRSR
ncbi:MAG: hypothetical protein HYU52_09485 [Acidobacteria bacterium]|nr:hypothetical protein [Acidobacteriota bacterium]